MATNGIVCGVARALLQIYNGVQILYCQAHIGLVSAKIVRYSFDCGLIFNKKFPLAFCDVIRNNEEFRKEIIA